MTKLVRQVGSTSSKPVLRARKGSSTELGGPKEVVYDNDKPVRRARKGSSMDQEGVNDNGKPVRKARKGSSMDQEGVNDNDKPVRKARKGSSMDQEGVNDNDERKEEESKPWWVTRRLDLVKKSIIVSILAWVYYFAKGLCQNEKSPGVYGGAYMLMYAKNFVGCTKCEVVENLVIDPKILCDPGSFAEDTINGIRDLAENIQEYSVISETLDDTTLDNTKGVNDDKHIHKTPSVRHASKHLPSNTTPARHYGEMLSSYPTSQQKAPSVGPASKPLHASTTSVHHYGERLISPKVFETVKDTIRGNKSAGLCLGKIPVHRGDSNTSMGFSLNPDGVFVINPPVPYEDEGLIIPYISYGVCKTLEAMEVNASKSEASGEEIFNYLKHGVEPVLPDTKVALEYMLWSWSKLGDFHRNPVRVTMESLGLSDMDLVSGLTNELVRGHIGKERHNQAIKDVAKVRSEGLKKAAVLTTLGLKNAAMMSKRGIESVKKTDISGISKEVVRAHRMLKDVTEARTGDAAILFKRGIESVKEADIPGIANKGAKTSTRAFLKAMTATNDLISTGHRIYKTTRVALDPHVSATFNTAVSWFDYFVHEIQSNTRCLKDLVQDYLSGPNVEVSVKTGDEEDIMEESVYTFNKVLESMSDACAIPNSTANLNDPYAIGERLNGIKFNGRTKDGLRLPAGAKFLVMIAENTIDPNHPLVNFRSEDRSHRSGKNYRPFADPNHPLVNFRSEDRSHRSGKNYRPFVDPNHPLLNFRSEERSPTAGTNTPVGSSDIVLDRLLHETGISEEKALEIMNFRDVRAFTDKVNSMQKSSVGRFYTKQLKKLNKSKKEGGPRVWGLIENLIPSIPTWNKSPDAHSDKTKVQPVKTTSPTAPALTVDIEEVLLHRSR